MVAKISEFQSQLHHIFWVLVGTVPDFSPPQSFSPSKQYFGL